jgi:hypothetical protein
MLSNEVIESNKAKFIELLSSVNREGIEDLINYISESDFFIAPASTIYHCDFDGGLCQHSLNVHMNLNFIIKAYGLDYPEETIILVSLLHDISKINFYEKYFRNQKLYNENGSKFDDLGKFDWVSILSYKVKDADLRDIGADHGTSSFILINKFIDLTDEERIAIINHHMGMGEAQPNKDMNVIANRYPLTFLLHLADMASSYICENKNIEEHRTKKEEEEVESTN